MSLVTANNFFDTSSKFLIIDHHQKWYVSDYGENKLYEIWIYINDKICKTTIENILNECNKMNYRLINTSVISVLEGTVITKYIFQEK